jgi:DNA-binding response OmpR family regulator
LIVLTGCNAVETRVATLDLSTDDYLLKPFALAELVARVSAPVRRAIRIPSGLDARPGGPFPRVA